MSIPKIIADESLGRWIRQNKGKTFAVATPDGVWKYSAVFTSHDDLKKERQKQQGILWFVDESSY